MYVCMLAPWPVGAGNHKGHNFDNPSPCRIVAVWLLFGGGPLFYF